MINDICILIVDDHALVRQGLEMMINPEPGLRVGGSIGRAEEVFDAIEKVNPDIITLDLTMPGMNGLELIKQIKSRYPDVRILVVSMHKEGIYAERCLRAGAQGYVMKEEPPERVIEAIRKLTRGEVSISDRIATNMVKRMMGGTVKDISPVEILSDRELEVFELLGEGQGTREISDRLNLSIKTVQSYRENIKKKLNLKSAPELEHFAYIWVIETRQ